MKAGNSGFLFIDVLICFFRGVKCNDEVGLFVYLLVCDDA